MESIYNPPLLFMNPVYFLYFTVLITAYYGLKSMYIYIYIIYTVQYYPNIARHC